MIRELEKRDISAMCEIWNEVVEEHNAFPQEEGLDETTGYEFFKVQSFSGVFEDDKGEILGLYILHPNNVGHCGHLSNASYAVKKGCRGHRVGEQMVLHSLAKGKELGFEVLQFNAVVKSNEAAIGDCMRS